MIREITATAFKDMIINAAAAIELEKQQINDLNVFPVPDGDTGTNMSLTINAAAAELKKRSFSTVSEAANITSSALLRGARGNSGVILSLLFRGIAKALKDCKTADTARFSAAMCDGVSAAYKAVMKPTEGTILTVSRLASSAALAASQSEEDFLELLPRVIEVGNEALLNTVEQNPVLKKAGVVDAGGKGYICILNGMLMALRGEMIDLGANNTAASDKADFASLTDEDITFTFDTVFIVRKTSGKSIEPLRAYLSSIGDSLVIGEDDEAFKVHVHTDIPGEALTEAQKYGTLELAKIENMRTQYEDMAAGRKTHSVDDLEAEEEAAEKVDDTPAYAAPEKKYGVVAVCAGEGMSEVYRELGADGIITGGQTMNPSTESILNEINKTPAEIVYVLPNNKNIIMAAEQCVSLAEGKKVVVIPTKTVPQGLTALIEMDTTLDEESLTNQLTESIKRVHTASITYAARDSVFDGRDIKAGEYLGLLEGTLVVNSSDLDAVINALVDELNKFEPEIVTLFYGEDVTEEQANATLSSISSRLPEAETSLVDGGQPVYYYMISAE